MTQSEAAFLFASWLASYRHASKFAKNIRKSVYYFWHHKIISNILARGGKVYVAEFNEVSEHVAGYICFEKQDNKLVLHYCYVKTPFRKLGIATALLGAHKPDYFTHLTNDSKYLTGKCAGIIYDPYRV